MNNDYEYNGSNEVYPSYTEYNNFQTNNMNIKPPKKKRKWSIILLILLLLLVGVLIYFTFFTDKLDFIKSDDKYSEFDPNKGKIESNSNIVSNSNKTSNSNSNTNEVKSISITPSTPSVMVGSKVTLKTTITPNDAKDKTITWKSSDTKIATVDSKGVITGIKEGTAIITATSKNGKKASVKVSVTIKEIPVKSIKLNKDKLEIEPNVQYLGLKVSITPNNATNQEIIWSSSNMDVAYIKDGFLYTKKEGTTIITATTKEGKYKASCTVIVKPKEVTSITLKGASTVYIGKTLTLDAWSNPVDSTMYWKSSDPNVATVSNSGVVTGIKAGKVTITAYTSNGTTSTKIIEVIHNASEYTLILKKQLGTQHYKGCYSSTLYRNGEKILNYKTFLYNNQTLYQNQPICPAQYDVDTLVTNASINFDDGSVVNNVKIIYE